MRGKVLCVEEFLLYVCTEVSLFKVKVVEFHGIAIVPNC